MFGVGWFSGYSGFDFAGFLGIRVREFAGVLDLLGNLLFHVSCRVGIIQFFGVFCGFWCNYCWGALGLAGV